MNKSEDQNTQLQKIVRSQQKTAFQDDYPSQKDMEKINQLSQHPLTADKVFIRSMYLCSTQPCQSDGCQFTYAALQDIANKVMGQSVLSGHNRRSLPLARFFKAQVIQRDEVSHEQPVYFVRAWFYWLRDTSGAKDLLLNIDGGIYREVSLAWKYNQWRCSICGTENSQCDHQVLQSYNGQTCYRLIDQVLDVLEGSLVYKSADHNTYLSGIHEERGSTEENTLVLICQKDDPLFHELKNHNLLTEVQPLQKIKNLCSQSLDHIWLRSNHDKNAECIASHFLSDHGICFIEHFDNQEEYRFLIKQEGNIHCLDSIPALEEHHDPVRPI